MSEPEPLASELKGFEASLAALVPSASAINRDRLMFEAGRGSRSSPVIPWSIALVSSAACCALLGLIFVEVSGHTGTSAPIAVHGDEPQEKRSLIDPAAAARLAEPDSYLQLRRRLAEADLAVVPSGRSPVAAPVATDRDALLRELLN